MPPAIYLCRNVIRGRVPRRCKVPEQGHILHSTAPYVVMLLLCSPCIAGAWARSACHRIRLQPNRRVGTGAREQYGAHARLQLHSVDSHSLDQYTPGKSWQCHGCSPRGALAEPVHDMRLFFSNAGASALTSGVPSWPWAPKNDEAQSRHATAANTFMFPMVEAQRRHPLGGMIKIVLFLAC